MDDRQGGEGPGRAAERALATALKAGASTRLPPEPPAALSDIAWGRQAARRPGPSSFLSGADLACAAALAACLACALAFGRVDGELAGRLDGPAIAGTVETFLERIGIDSIQQ